MTKEFIIFAIIGLVLVFIVSEGIIKYLRINKIKLLSREILLKFGKIETVDERDIFIYKNVSYELHYVYIPKNLDLSINNEITWQVYGTKDKLLNMQKLALNNKRKIVIIYPSEERIKRYINENEVEFVNFKITYTYYAILLKDLEDFINSL